MTASKRIRERGFSLAEVLIAMFVIVVGISGVTATIWWGSSKSDSGKLIQEASNVGRIIMESMATKVDFAGLKSGGWFPASSGINDAPNDRRAINAAPLGVIGVLPTQHILNTSDNTHSNLDRYLRNITCTRLAAAGSGTYDESLMTVRVSTYWQDKRSPTNPTLREHVVRHELVMEHI